MPKEIHPYAVLHRPVITEKSTELAEEHKYVFEVDPRANKMQIKEAVEIGFQVVVRKVNVLTMHGKQRRMRRQTGREQDVPLLLEELVRHLPIAECDGRSRDEYRADDAGYRGEHEVVPDATVHGAPASS